MELLVALPRFCRQRTALGTCRPVVTWKLPHHTWGVEDRKFSQESQHPKTGPLLLLQQAHREGWEQRLCELGLEGVQELFGASIVERQEAWGEGSRETGVRRKLRNREGPGRGRWRHLGGSRSARPGSRARGCPAL